MVKNKYFFLLILLVGINCTNEDTQNFNPDDWDGDGVSNEKEYFDNTDPNDPCSVNTSSQYPPNIPESWKLLDCDGDGVTNQQETEDLTYPFNLCDFNSDHQDLNLISEDWKIYDCDGDGVTNSQELEDETDPKDNCSFKASNIVTPLDFWLTLDCDNDGRNNSQELTDNTNPLDAQDFLGAGDKIVTIKAGNGYTHHFIENGTLLDKIVKNSDNSIITNFEYNTLGKLIKVTIFDNEIIIVSFSYNNNLLEKIIRKEGNNEVSYDVVYDTNIIYTYTNTLPNNVFSGKYTFNTNNKIIKEEHNYSSGTNSVENFEYNTNGDILKSNYTIGQNSGSYNYGVLEGIKNPMKTACENIYIQYVLMNEILSKSFYLKFGIFSTEFTNYMNRNSPPTSHSFNYGVLNVQANGYPILGYHSDFSYNFDIEYYYKN